ncbi:MAG: VanZ family protein [Myxococcota bacterium]
MIRVLPARAVLVGLYVLAMLALSSLPARQVARLGLPAPLVNFAHVPLFAGLAWVTLRALLGPQASRVMLCAAFCLGFAVVDEWIQSFVPGRVPALDDVLADASGVAIGIVLREGVRPMMLVWKGGWRE